MFLGSVVGRKSLIRWQETTWNKMEKEVEEEEEEGEEEREKVSCCRKMSLRIFCFN